MEAKKILLEAEVLVYTGEVDCTPNSFNSEAILSYFSGKERKKSQDNFSQAGSFGKTSHCVQ